MENKQMKLYTEEEILSLLKIHLADEDQADSFVALLTPIELPSDQDVEQHVEQSNSSLEFDTGFKYGAEWMRDKIQGGNNEQ